MVVRLPRITLASPAFLVLNGLSLGLGVHPLYLIGAVLGVLGLPLLWRTRTELDPDGVTTCDGLRTRRTAWADVVAVTTYDRGVRLLTRAGDSVPLPNVLKRAWAPEGQVARNSAQAVVGYAAAHGRDVELREAAPAA